MNIIQKCSLPGPFRILAARHLADPVIDAGKDRKDRAQRHHIVEMRHDVIGVVIGAVPRAPGDSTTPVTPPTVNRNRKPRPRASAS